MNLRNIIRTIKRETLTSRIGNHQFFFYIRNLGWMSSNHMKKKEKYMSEMTVDVKKGRLLKSRYTGYEHDTNEEFNLFVEAILELGNKDPRQIADLMDSKRKNEIK